MMSRDRSLWENRLEAAIANLSDRLETLRATVVDYPRPLRLQVEPQLDRLRGQVNRALARLEAARRADDGAWLAARASAETVYTTLRTEVDEFQSRYLHRAAA